MKEVIHVKGLKVAMPLSQAIRCHGFVYVSGNVPVNRAEGGAVAEGDIRAQTRQTLENIGKVLDAAGLDFTDIIKNTVYLTDVSDFAGMNEVYAEFFPTDPPARTTVGISALNNPKFLIEIDSIALDRDK